MTVPSAGQPGPRKDRRRRRGRRGTARWRWPRRTAAPPPSCSATPSTTRRRPSCSGSPAAPAPGRWPGCPPRRGALPAAAAHRAPRHHRPGLRRPGPASPGTTRTTATPVHQGPGAPPGAPALEAALGPGVTEALARTASQLRADAERSTTSRRAESRQQGRRQGSTRMAAGAARGDEDPGAARRGAGPGCPHGSLTAGTSSRLDALVTGWRGQRLGRPARRGPCAARMASWLDRPCGTRPAGIGQYGGRDPGWTQLTWDRTCSSRC